MYFWQQISFLLLPLAFVFILMVGHSKDVKVFELFVEGAGEGFKTILSIMPYLIAMLVAIRFVQASGLLDGLAQAGSWALRVLPMQVPGEVIPLFFLRPLSGSGSLAYITTIFAGPGPDSAAGLLASTLQGSPETTFYVASVYYGAVGIKDPRYSIKVGLLADLAGFLAAITFTNIFLL
ncbi:MAG: spore maturation protein [Halanaerobium sp.]|nr:spore maturation protein [Halanaerobium sp.]